MKNLLSLNEKYGLNRSYKQFEEPVYRGLGLNRLRIEDYKPNSI